MQKTAVCRWMGVVAMLGLVFFFITALVLQFARADLDWYTAPISFYLLGPYGPWLITAYFLLATAILCVAIGTYLALEPPARRLLPLPLFAVGAVCVCIVALAHTSIPDTPHAALVSTIHKLTAFTAFLTVSVAMLLQSWTFRQAQVWRAYFIKAFGLAVLAFIALLLCALWKALPNGAAEKTVILLIVLWLMLVSRWLTRLKPEA